jgi:hypothetical protein
MLTQDKLSSTAFDAEVLESLLHLEEGPILDFKREQYRFNQASDRDKSELFKDILAFANSQRYRTGYILVGVEEVKGGRSEVVGVQEQLDDAILHQFVNSKTNRPVAFSYFPFGFEGREIGVLSIPLQVRPVYSLRKYGIVQADTVYVRDGSSTGIANPDNIAEMGRAQTPRLLEWFIRRLRNAAMHTVTVTAQQWCDHPRRQHGPDLPKRPQDYAKARDVILRLTESRVIEPEAFSKGIDSYLSLRWVFKTFEELADQCTQAIRTTGPSFMEFGALAGAVLQMEGRINFEKRVWDEYRARMEDERYALPNPANHNILILAREAVRFVEILEGV